MDYRISKEHVWVCLIEDRRDAMAERLRALSDGGVDLELIITRREKQGRALMFVSPLRTPEEVQTAQELGLSIADSVHNLRIAGPNTRGLGARMATALAEAGISMRGYTAAALGDLQVTNIAFDSIEHEDRAKTILEDLLRS